MSVFGAEKAGRCQSAYRQERRGSVRLFTDRNGSELSDWVWLGEKNAVG